MKRAQYLSEFGADWQKFIKKPAGVAFLEMIRDEHPSLNVHKLAATDRLNGAAVFLNEGAGYSILVELIAGLSGTPASTEEPPDRFAESEIQ